MRPAQLRAPGDDTVPRARAPAAAPIEVRRTRRARASAAASALSSNSISEEQAHAQRKLGETVAQWLRIFAVRGHTDNAQHSHTRALGVD